MKSKPTIFGLAVIFVLSLIVTLYHLPDIPGDVNLGSRKGCKRMYYSHSLGYTCDECFITTWKKYEKDVVGCGKQSSTKKKRGSK